MAETTHLSWRRLRGDFPSLSALPGLRAFRHCATRSPDCARRAANAVYSRDRSQLESARAGDRLALLSGRDLVAPLRKSALGGCADHGLQSTFSFGNGFWELLASRDASWPRAKPRAPSKPFT